jgi:hypothetical protein
MAQVGIIMGSDSDLPIMQEAIDILRGFDIAIEVDIVSAHRTPYKLMEYGKTAHTRGLKVIIFHPSDARWCACGDSCSKWSQKRWDFSCPNYKHRRQMYSR